MKICRAIRKLRKVGGFWLLGSMAVATAKAEIPQWWQEVHNWDGLSDWTIYMNYTAGYFGPNALPVPELMDGRIPQKHAAEFSTDIFWGYGDQTQSLSTRWTYVLVPGRIALSTWGVIGEHYRTTLAVRDQRASLDKDPQGIEWLGDFYVATQCRLMQEDLCRPDLMLEIVLKTASSFNASSARFVDTPGYYFSLNAGKSLLFPDAFIKELRFIGDIGFFSYEMNSSRQNDSPLYRGGIQLQSGNWSLLNSFGGYAGWTNKGDRPFVLRSKLNYQKGAVRYFMQYQHALNDYPFERLQTGVSLDF
ncbi:MAG: hypothetical protein Q8914_03110 [Bacteroidota bacterium]|nr:hypothetical protein [Bacteroidota bacterium]